jgi:hypothetical protein
MVSDIQTWAVVATVDEPPGLVQAFVAWHLSLGADAVFIYCDKPDDPVQQMLSHLPQVTVISCDEPHWLRLGKSRPRRHQVRQVRNARDAYTRARTDWILHSDADEFLWPGTSVAQTLAQVDADADCLTVRVAERVHLSTDAGQSVLEGAFRRPFQEPAKKGRKIFGPEYALTYRGLTGHAQGKAFVRTGRDVKLSIHRPRPLNSDQEVALARADVSALELLHFDGLTADFWIYKLARMAHALAKTDGMPPSPHRRKQADALISDMADAVHLYQRMKCPDDQMRALLKEYGLWTEPPFDPSAAIFRYFPDQTVELTPLAIDGWLQQFKANIRAFLNK